MGLLPDSRATCPRLASPPPPESPGWEAPTIHPLLPHLSPEQGGCPPRLLVAPVLPCIV